MKRPVVLALTSLVTAFAQEISITGKVTDAWGRPLAGAVVSLAATPLRDTTGPDGVYSLYGRVDSGQTSVRPLGQQRISLRRAAADGRDALGRVGTRAAGGAYWEAGAPSGTHGSDPATRAAAPGTRPLAK